MKIKTTRKYLSNVYANVYRAGYCDLQYIMHGKDPMYYNSGIYGWNFDAYVDCETDTVITTGYRNMIGERVPDEIIEKYTKKAKEILSCVFSDKNAQLKLRNIQRAFWDELNSYNIPQF